MQPFFRNFFTFSSVTNQPPGSLAVAGEIPAKCWEPQGVGVGIVGGVGNAMQLRDETGTWGEMQRVLGGGLHMRSPKDKRKERYMSLIYFLEKSGTTSRSTAGESTRRAQEEGGSSEMCGELHQGVCTPSFQPVRPQGMSLLLHTCSSSQLLRQEHMLWKVPAPMLAVLRFPGKATWRVNVSSSM